MNNDLKYRYDSNYINEANFTRIKKGSDSPLLETEINDMQIIQEKNRLEKSFEQAYSISTINDNYEIGYNWGNKFLQRIRTENLPTAG